jgi:hypothetical protein
MKAKLSIFMVILMASACMAQLAGYWNFDEGSGTTAADSSGNGKNGILGYQGSGAVPQWIAGHDGTGSALLFNNGVTSAKNSNRVIVDITTTDGLANLMKTGKAFTISMWVRTDALLAGNWRYPVYTDAYAYWLALDPNDTGSGSTSIDDFFSSDANSAWNQINLQYVAPVQKEIGTWYHLALSYDGNFLKRYINGKFFLLYVPAPINDLPIATTDLYIGSMSNGTKYFKGALDDIAIWSGSYLPDSEIAKLANGTATPLTVTQHVPEAQLPVIPWESEEGMGWNCGVAGKAWNYGKYNDSTGPGWEACWSQGYTQQMRLMGNNGKNAWSAYTQDWCKSPLLPGDKSAVYSYNSHAYPVKFSNDANIYEPNWTGKYADVNTHGVCWIDRSWDPGDMNGTNEIATIAAYITPGIAILHGSYGYKVYDPDPARVHPSECIPYFKTYARFAPENAPAGCKFSIRLFTTPTYPDAPNPITDGGKVMTYYDELEIPIVAGNHQWQEFKGTLPKPVQVGGTGDYPDRMPRVWFELSIEGGNPNTVLYIDEFAPISDMFLQHVAKTSIYQQGDINQNSIVYWDDIETLADNWLSPYNFIHFNHTANDWLKNAFNNISGDPCDPAW